MEAVRGTVVAVHTSSRHTFSKQPVPAVELIAGVGIAGDAHAGMTVQHRYDRRKSPHRPNLRQVHLLATEVLEALAASGQSVKPGDLGENITTQRLDLANLPCGTCLQLGPDAVLQLTGLRQPCVLIDRFRPGLQALMYERKDGVQRARAGVMATVLQGGIVRAGDPIRVTSFPEPQQRLQYV